LDSSPNREQSSEDSENASSLWGERNYANGGEVIEPENNSVTDENQTLVITSENLPFSKMKQLMTIVSWNPWDITIQVLWNEMKVSEKWLNELKKLIKE
jgi:hypothetical protein